MNKNHNVIGEGTYGCLHNISLRCDKDKVNNDYDISKVTSKEYGEDELKKNATMDIIDKEYRFHLGKSKKCTIKNNKINKDAIGKCLQSTKIDKENITNNVLILMKDGGIDLEKFAIKIQDYKSTRTNVNMMKKFWIEVERLLLGIQLFQKNNFIHHDVKPQNILFDEKNIRLNYSDFGLSNSLTQIKKESIESRNELSQEWWSYPPEYKYVNKNVFHLYQNEIEVDDCNTIEESKHLREFLPYIVYWKEQYLDDLQYLYRDGYYDYDSLLDKCLKTFDIYSLGFTLLLISDSSRHLIDPVLFYDLTHLFYETITPIFSKRIEIEELLEDYRELLLMNNLITSYKKKNINIKK